MKNIVLHPNAVPLYGFLSVIHAHEDEGEISVPSKILDCGDGGSIPPLALFHQHGLEAWGIDLSEPLLRMARSAASEANLDLRVRFEKADAQDLPYNENRDHARGGDDLDRRVAAVLGSNCPGAFTNGRCPARSQPWTRR